MIFTGTSGNLRYVLHSFAPVLSDRLYSSTALYIASLIEVGTGKDLTRVEVAAIAWGVNILSGVMNTVGTKAIGRMSAFNVWWTLGGTFVLVITLLVKAPTKVMSQFDATKICVTNIHRILRSSYLQTMRSNVYRATSLSLTDAYQLYGMAVQRIRDITWFSTSRLHA